MPKQKDLKRLVRARISKTGESYTAARARLLQKRATPAPPAAATDSRYPEDAPAATAPPPAPDYATLAGLSDAALVAKTGCDWRRWVECLDRHHAASLPHREIAELVATTFQVPGWWAQTVTVGYERIKGLREIGQRRSGTYEATKSKTLPVPIGALYRELSVAARRRHWLPGIAWTVRKVTPEKSIRLSWEGGSSVEIYLVAKGPGKSQIAIQHRALPTRARASEARSFWSERLDALAARLAR